MKWLAEIRATRRSLAEIGLLVVVREVFRNRCEMQWHDADETLGPGWAVHAKALAKAGMLNLQHDGLSVRMSVIAPGDKKRERLRKLGTIARWENRIGKQLKKGCK
jgi:hypothetical protein